MAEPAIKNQSQQSQPERDRHVPAVGTDERRRLIEAVTARIVHEDAHVLAALAER